VTLSRSQLLVALGVMTTALYAVLLVVDLRLQATGGPSIVGLEFAGSEARAAEIMVEWGDHGRDLARASLWLDFGLMLGYGAFFALAAVAIRDFARENGRLALAAAGRVAPYLAIGAVVFDAVEDVIWLLVLDGRGGSVGPPLATACACLKFLLFGLALAYAIWGLASRLRGRGGVAA
jgi:hypothetical protein